MRSEPEERVCSDCAPSTAALAGKATVEGTTRSAEASPGQVGGGADVGLGEAKDTGCGERSAGDRDRISRRIHHRAGDSVPWSP